MALVSATQNMKMIDKLNMILSCICLLLTIVEAAPTLSPEGLTSTHSTPNENVRGKTLLSSEVEYLSTTKSKSPPMSTLPMTSEETKALVTTPTPRANLKSKLLSNPSTSMKPRKNKNGLFFCCTDDNLESATETVRRSKERERNTKPPILKRGKNPESEEPFFERRPALLLRFFPDGTAVLISKFQLHLHVKPKQISFDPEDDPEEDPKLDEPLDYDPSIILNDGKSFEVTYKRLEAIPTAREQNLDELPEEETNNSVSDVHDDGTIDHRDHEFVTPSDSSMIIPEAKNISAKPSPLLDSTDQPVTTATSLEQNESVDTVKNEEINVKKREKVTSTIGDSPFFIMTSGEMSALQHQYEPAQAEPLKATPSPQIEERTTSSPIESVPTTQTDPEPTTTTVQITSEDTTETTIITTEPTTTTTKCLSFRNQLSLALSTEDNIDNSLLKKHILPVEDCNTPEEEKGDAFARIQSLEPTSTEPTTTTVTAQPIISSTTQIATTSNADNSLVSYLSSRLVSNPSKSDAVVVTSLPVLIDLKNNINRAVTDVPAWREVTVGVVRDQQGHPLKPKYNNWTAHLRGLKKKAGNEFWNDLTTPKPVFTNHHRLPAHQNIQQAPSHVHQAYWTDLQRQRPPVDHQQPRSRQTVNSQQYNINPPRNYHAPNVNDFHWRSSAYNSNNNRWNANIPETFHPSEDVRRMKRPLGTNRNVENQEIRQPPQWNHGNPRRW